MEQVRSGAETDAHSEPSCHPDCLEAIEKSKFIKASKMIRLIFIYRAINGFVDYRPSAKL